MTEADISVLFFAAVPVLLAVWALIYAYRNPDDVDPEMVLTVVGCCMLVSAPVVLERL